MQTWYMYEYKIYIRTYKKIEKKPKKHHIYKLVCIKKSKKKRKNHIYKVCIRIYIKNQKEKKTELNRKEKNKKKNETGSHPPPRFVVPRAGPPPPPARAPCVHLASTELFVHLAASAGGSVELSVAATGATRKRSVRHAVTSILH
jgi:hypothetical protein